MKISPGEQKAIKTVVALGEVYGYGNLISHLSTAWAKMLISKHKMTEDQARDAAGCDRGMPFAMQDDLINNGEYDESGKKYTVKVVG